jgi:hypothetical protein
VAPGEPVVCALPGFVTATEAAANARATADLRSTFCIVIFLLADRARLHQFTTWLYTRVIGGETSNEFMIPHNKQTRRNLKDEDRLGRM